MQELHQRGLGSSLRYVHVPVHACLSSCYLYFDIKTNLKVCDWHLACMQLSSVTFQYKRKLIGNLWISCNVILAYTLQFCICLLELQHACHSDHAKNSWWSTEIFQQATSRKCCSRFKCILSVGKRRQNNKEVSTGGSAATSWTGGYHSAWRRQLDKEWTCQTNDITTWGYQGTCMLNHQVSI